MQSLRPMLNVFLFPATTLKDSSQWFCIFIIHLSSSLLCVCVKDFSCQHIFFSSVYLWIVIFEAYRLLWWKSSRGIVFFFFIIWIYFSSVIVDIRMYRPFEKLFDEDFLLCNKLLINLLGRRSWFCAFISSRELNLFLNNLWFGVFCMKIVIF